MRTHFPFHPTIYAFVYWLILTSDLYARQIPVDYSRYSGIYEGSLGTFSFWGNQTRLQGVFVTQTDFYPHQHEIEVVSAGDSGQFMIRMTDPTEACSFLIGEFPIQILPGNSLSLRLYSQQYHFQYKHFNHDLNFLNRLTGDYAIIPQNKDQVFKSKLCYLQVKVTDQQPYPTLTFKNRKKEQSLFLETDDWKILPGENAGEYIYECSVTLDNAPMIVRLSPVSCPFGMPLAEIVPPENTIPEDLRTFGSQVFAFQKMQPIPLSDYQNSQEIGIYELEFTKRREFLQVVNINMDSIAVSYYTEKKQLPLKVKDLNRKTATFTVLFEEDEETSVQIQPDCILMNTNGKRPKVYRKIY